MRGEKGVFWDCTDHLREWGRVLSMKRVGLATIQLQPLRDLALKWPFMAVFKLFCVRNPTIR